MDKQSEFENLYVSYHDRLVTVARRYVRSEVVAQDIVADSFVAFWNRSDLLSEGNRPAYLMSIVKNNCLNYLQTKQIHSRIEDQMHSMQSRMVEASIRSLRAMDPDKLFSSDIEELVSQALRKMPELTRTVFELSRVERKTYKEIAEALGISERKVTSEIQRALAILRKALKDYMPLWLLTLYLNGLIR